MSDWRDVGCDPPDENGIYQVRKKRRTEKDEYPVKLKHGEDPEWIVHYSLFVDNEWYSTSGNVTSAKYQDRVSRSFPCEESMEKQKNYGTPPYTEWRAPPSDAE